MFIFQLLKEYKKRLGFKNVFIRNVKINKWIILYMFISVGFPVLITLLFFNRSILWMFVSIILYLTILFLGGKQHQRKMYITMPPGSLAYNTKPLREMLREVFFITTDEQYLILDEIVKREIASVEHARKYPLMDIVRQLVVALVVTGLLSFAVFELKEGNFDQAKPLLSVYLFIIGVTFAVGGLLKQIREFGSGSYLNDISFLLQLCLLENSINKSQQQKPPEHESFFPSRRNKRI